jgi:hypothetical protein
MKTFIITTILLISQAALADNFRFECIDEVGGKHSLELGNALILNLKSARKLRFDDERVGSVTDPVIYTHYRSGEIRIRGQFNVRKLRKGRKIINSVSNFYTLFTENSLSQGEDGKLSLVHEKMTASRTGSLTGIGGEETVKIYIMDCYKK